MVASTSYDDTGKRGLLTSINFEDGSYLDISISGGKVHVGMRSADLDKANGLAEVFEYIEMFFGTEGYPFYSDNGLANGIHQIAAGAEDINDFRHMAYQSFFKAYKDDQDMGFRSNFSVSDLGPFATAEINFTNSALADIRPRADGSGYIVNVVQARDDCNTAAQALLDRWSDEAGDRYSPGEFLRKFVADAFYCASPEQWLEVLERRFPELSSPAAALGR